jgi:hypothetical protein
VRDAPDDEIQVIRATYGSGEKLGDLSFTFELHNVHLKSQEVECDGDRFFFVRRPDGAVQRFRENPESGNAEPVDSIPCGDPSE